VPETKNPVGKVGGERKTDQTGRVDESVRGRNNGPDIDVEKREKELERESPKR
jgi:hypothetical protein